MIDFLSTEENIDPQTARCAQLLAAVLATAVRDLQRPLRSREREGGVGNLDLQALSSLRFFFGRQGWAFEAYCNSIGAQPETFRSALLRDEVVRWRWAVWKEAAAAEDAAAAA